MSITALAKSLTLGLESQDICLTDAERNIILEALKSADASVETKIQLLGFSFGIGDVSDLEGGIDALLEQMKSENIAISDGLKQISGFVDMFRTGFIIPERRAPRTRTLQRTVLNFYHAIPPFHSSGYAMRSHALATAARDHGTWQHKHHSRIGYPWDVRGKHRNPTTRTTWYDGIPYLHDRGGVSARGDLRAYIQAATPAIRRAIYLERPSVVQAASAYVNALPVLIAAREMGVPFIYEVRGLWEITAAMGRQGWKETDRFKIDYDIECLIAREADGVIAITDGVRKELIRRGVAEDKIILSPNSVSEGSLTPLPPNTKLQEKLGLNPHIPTLGYIGSFVKYEGLELLIEACQRLRKEGYEFNLLLVGDGPHYAMFKSHLEEIGCIDEVVLPGRVPHEEVENYYSLIDITVFPRLPYEVCELVSPLKPLEALLLEKLVIGSSVGGIREIIEHEKNGLIFKAGSIDDLTYQLRQAISIPEQFDALRRRGGKWVRENRKWSQNIETVEALLERVARPVLRPLEAPLLVVPGQVISAQTSVARASDTLEFTYTDMQGQVIMRCEDLVASDNEKQISIESIVPQKAVQLREVTSRTQNQVSVSSAPLETYYRTQKNSRYPLIKNLPVTRAPLETKEIGVTPGAHYRIFVDVVTPAQVPNHALIGIILLDGNEDALHQTGLRTVDERDDSVYCYLEQEVGQQIIDIKIPQSVSKISIYLQTWSGKALPPPQISSQICLEEIAENSSTQHSHLAPRQENQVTSLGELVLSTTPVTAVMHVEAGRRYDLIFEAQVIPGQAQPSSSSGVITFIGQGQSGNTTVAFPKMRYSDSLQAHYNYFSYGVKTTIPLEVPEGVTEIEVGLRCWNAPDKSLIATDNITLSEKSSHEFNLDWNIDRSRTNILLFADLDVNLTDGSAVWMVSMASALSKIENTTLHVLLRKPITDSPFVNELNKISNCKIIESVSHFDNTSSFSSDCSSEIISKIDEMVGGFDYLIVRGFQVNYNLTKYARLSGRLCPYLTDIPQTEDSLEQSIKDKIELVFRRAGAIFLQSEWLISFVKKKFPAHADKIWKLPPMLPEIVENKTLRAGAFPIRGALEPKHKSEALKIVYAGKMAPEWGILELFDAFDTLREDFPELELHVLGSKIHNPPEDPEYREKIITRLRAGNGLTWKHSLDRQTVLRLLPEFTVGWCWRDPEFENSNLELSTKLLEYGASGLPVILTRTDRYKELLGENYPLLADNYAGALDALRLALQDKEVRQFAATTLDDILAPHVMETVSKNSLSPALPAGKKKSEQILFAGHDLKFSGDIQSALITEGYNVQTDLWKGHEGHDEGLSTRLLQSSDIVFCEWALGNLVWYSHRVQPGQKLITRLHAQELFTDYPRDVKWDAVDKIIFVSEAYRRMGIEQFQLPKDKCVVIPNGVNTDWFAPKGLHVHGKRLGIMGIVPWLKRPDRAVRLLEFLHKEDPEFSLNIKGKLPSDYPWMRSRIEESEQYSKLIRHIISKSGLKDAITFDGFGHDIPIWASNIDFILSTSDRESFHLAIPEAVAAGATPVILSWEGANEIYPLDWILTDEEEAAEYILRKVSYTQKTRKRRARENRDFIARNFSAQSVSNAIIDIMQA